MAKLTVKKGGEFCIMKNTGRYILNIKTGVIHDSEKACIAREKMVEKNSKKSNSYEELINFFEGEEKGKFCGICMRERRMKK
ncbi:hypothetical protein ACDL92_00955 [Ihubacter sp. mB4P-1]|uniref:hypothetical protein n=1 Tax=Ihubacter sp. mB4P-1 TaxID=3242370 RepID=UPI003C7CB97F